MKSPTARRYLGRWPNPILSAPRLNYRRPRSARTARAHSGEARQQRRHGLPSAAMACARRATWGRPGLLALVLAGCLSATVGLAAAALRTGQDSDGARFRLSGRTLVLELPKGTPPDSRVGGACGRAGSSGRRVSGGHRTFRSDRRLRFRLRRDVSRTAEWCTFETSKFNADASQLPYGAVALRPRLAVPPTHLRSGPGVREAATTSSDGEAYGGFAGEDGDARFLLSGRVLTVRLRERSTRSELVTLACTQGSDPDSDRSVGYRSVVLPAGKHVVTADLEARAEDTATGCLIEGTGGRSGDIAAAAFE